MTCGCGNRRLADDIARYRLLHRGFNRITADYETLQQALAEQLEILEALESHNGARANQAMEHHIAYWQVYFVDKFHEDA